MGGCCKSEVGADRIVLSYFPAHARGELCRLVLAHSGVAWENKKVTIGWLCDMIGRKCCGCIGMSPSNTLPMLQIDGHKLTGSVAIVNYLGKKFNLHHDDPYQAWIIDAVIDNITDFVDNYAVEIFMKRV